MIGRAAVTVANTGRILRLVDIPPEMLGLNVRDGEAMFLITNDDGGSINTDHVMVSEAGEMVLTEAAPESATAPAYELQYVAV